MLEKAAMNEEERDRDKFGDKLEAFLTRKEEERKNVVVAQRISFEAEEKSLQSSARICRGI